MFGRMARIVTSLGALAMALTVLPVLAATPAVAVEGCGGNLVKVKDLRMPNGTKIGELQVFYNPSNGNNCAEMHHGGPTWGVNRLTMVDINKCQTTVPTGNCNVVDDATKVENVAFWAGPVVVHAGAHCIRAGGWIDWQGGLRFVSTGETVLCGG